MIDKYQNNYGFTWAVRTGGSGALTIPKTGQTLSYATGDNGDIRSGAYWPNPRFVDNGNGTVTDNLTGLVWQQSPSSTYRTWADALTYCTDLTLGGYTDWRLPNLNELESVVNRGQSNLATWLNSPGQKFFIVLTIVWSSNTSPGNTAWAWIVSMANGDFQPQEKQAGQVWAVRSGQ